LLPAPDPVARVVTLDELARLLDDAADPSGQWDGGDVCDALYRIAAPAMVTCKQCQCVSWSELMTCPFCTDDETVAQAQMDRIPQEEP
jgi:hypothetical protein